MEQLKWRMNQFTVILAIFYRRFCNNEYDPLTNNNIDLDFVYTIRIHVFLQLLYVTHCYIYFSYVT